MTIYNVHKNSLTAPLVLQGFKMILGDSRILFPVLYLYSYGIFGVCFGAFIGYFIECALQLHICLIFQMFQLLDSTSHWHKGQWAKLQILICLVKFKQEFLKGISVLWHTWSCGY